MQRYPSVLQYFLKELTTELKNQDAWKAVKDT